MVGGVLEKRRLKMKAFGREVLLFLGLVFSICMVTDGASRFNHRRYRHSAQRRHPPRNPNPFPSMEDLEEQASSDEVVDTVLDHIVGVNGGVVIDRYIPSGKWLWQQWHSSVFSNTVEVTCSKMLTSFLTCCLLRRMTFGDWKVWKHPSTANTLDPQYSFAMWQAIDHFRIIWKGLLPLAALVVTFFVGQAYSFWVSIYVLCRTIQGKISDIQLLLATHVRRKQSPFHLQRGPFGRQRVPPNKSTYTPDAEIFLEEISHQLRAFHILFWASQARRFRILLTDRGMNRMVSKGILTKDEKEILDLQLGVPKTQKHWIVLESIVLQCKEAHSQAQSTGRRNKAVTVLEGGSGLEQTILEKICSLRSACTQISHEMVARMAFPYVQFVQVLVDSFLFLAPIAQYKELGIGVVLSTGILTIFYSGLLGLAYDFLDPLLDDREYRGSTNSNGTSDGDDNSAMYFDLSVLVRESTATARRWVNAGSKLRGFR